MNNFLRKHYNSFPFTSQLLNLLLTLVLLAVFSCGVEEGSDPSVVNFLNSSISHPEDGGEKEVEISVSPATNTNGEIYITMSFDESVVYGEDFTTMPEMIDNEIKLSLEGGQEKVAFKVIVTDNDEVEGSKTITFRIKDHVGNLIPGPRSTMFFNIIDTDVLPEPALEFNEESIDFGDVMQTETSEVLSYEITKINLHDQINVSSNHSAFLLSKLSDGPFEESLVLEENEFEEGKASVYVKFVPGILDLGIIQSQIIHESVNLINSYSFNVSGNAVNNPALSTLQWIENFDYEGEIVPAEPNGGSTAVNQQLSRDLWMAVRDGRTGIPLSDEVLAFEGYPGSGIGRSAIMYHDGTNTTNNNYSRNLENYVTSDASDVVTSEFRSTYVAFLFKLEENHTSTMTNPVCLGNWNANGSGNSQMNTYVIVDVKAGGKAGVGIQNPNNPSRTIVDNIIEVGKTYLIVLKNEKLDGPNNDLGSVFVIEAGEDIPLQEPASIVTVAAPANERDIEKVILESSNCSNKMLIGGIRVANTWGDLF